MNGVVEESGKVASNVVTALTTTPTLLVMVLLNMTMIGAAAWFLSVKDASANRTVQIIIERCFPSKAEQHT